jgi:hypothetical protein
MIIIGFLTVWDITRPKTDEEIQAKMDQTKEQIGDAYSE